MSMIFEWEANPVPLFKTLNSLLRDHKEEVSMYEGQPLSPDWVTYTKLYEAGQLCVVTARKDGDIVGYTVNIIHRHLHYPFTIGINDIIYLSKPYRGYGIKLIKYTELCIKDKGVAYFVLSIKPHIDYRKVLERLGYDLLEYNYFRRL